MRFVIGLDIDGVIADFVTEFRSVVMEEYGAELEDADIRAHALRLALGVAEEESRRLVRLTLLRELDLYPGAQRGLGTLVGAGAEVHVITARPAGANGTRETEEWLTTRGLFPGKHYHRVDHARPGEKHAVPAHLDVFADDDLDELIGMAEHRPGVRLVVFDHPWNQTLDVHRRLRRVQDWDQLPVVLLQIRDEFEANRAGPVPQRSKDTS